MTRLHGVDHGLITSCACSVCEGVRRRLQSAPTRDLLPRTVTATTMTDIAATLPAHCGFAPVDSVCVVGVDEDGRVGPIARTDFADVPDTIGQIGEAFRLNGANRVIVLGICDDEVTADLAAHEMASGLNAYGIESMAVDAVPNSAVTIPNADEFAAAMRNDNLAAFSPRDTVAESFKPVSASEFDLPIDVRDELVAAIHPENSREESVRWHEIAVRTSNPDAYGIAGYAYYVSGSGGHARLAFEQALAVNPKHSFSKLMLTALQAGIPPKEIHAVWQTAMNHPNRPAS